jgi:TPR repeat protein
MYKNGWGTASNIIDVVRLYREAADLGNVIAQFNCGIFLRDGRGAERSPTEALKYLTLAVYQEYSHAYIAIGEMYRDGDGIEEDSDESAKCFNMQMNRNTQVPLRV